MRHAPSVRANSWEDVADLSARLGVVLDEWQETVLEAAMGERSDGSWAARLVGVSAPRQQGKSQLIVARALAGVLLFNEKQIIASAHQTDTAREVFQRLLDIIDDNPAVKRRVSQVMRALNREFIRFDDGQTIRIKARSVAGSRGFSADCLLLDEAQILGRAAWSSIYPTVSARPNAQAWLLGTPPRPEDDGEVFGQLRDQGIAGTGSRLTYVEWSADARDDLDDPVVWAKANPAYGSRISHEAIESERSSMTDDQFAMERLGVWGAVSTATVIDAQTWALVADEESRAVERFVLAVDVNPERSTSSVAFAGLRADGMPHFELDETRDGTSWVMPWLLARWENDPICAVVVDEQGPAATFIDELRAEKVKVVTTGYRDIQQACGQFFDAVVSGAVRHVGQPQLAVAMSAVRKRPLGDRFAWNRKNSSSDITPIVAATLALWGVQSGKVPTRKVPGERRSGSRVLVMS